MVNTQDLIKALREIDEDAADYVETKAPKLINYIDNGRDATVGGLLEGLFLWDDTPQGNRYWGRLAEILRGPHGNS